jgi:hypothetical protein
MTPMLPFAHSPRFQRAKRALIALLASAHMACVMIANLPDNVSLGKALHGFADPYLRAFGQWQEWDMFTTIPLYADIRAKLVARGEDGSETRYDPMLPGLTPQPDSLRVMSLFARLVWSRKPFTSYVARFHAAACRAIGQRSGSIPKTVRVELHVQALRSPRAVRQTGVSTDPRLFKSEDTPCLR